MSGWQPIQTAPMDGTWVLGLWLLPDRAPLYGVVRWGVLVDHEWAGSEPGWIEGSEPVANPTHWMPIPEGPTS